ncbi:MAG TPA: hypothetical protein VK907_08045 [Phnomibacter sp.]|nr:hypothetical protein [Phnomibacter sp.]
MKFVVSLLLIIVLGITASVFANETPWWLFTIGAFLGGLVVPQSSWRSFLAGFLGIMLLWLVMVFIIDSANESIMSARMASILPLQGSSALLMLGTAIVGGILGGMAALTGSLLRKKPSL